MIDKIQSDVPIRHRKIMRVSQIMKWFLSLCLILLVLIASLITVELFGLDPFDVGANMVDYGEIERSYNDLPKLQQIGLVISELVILGAIIFIVWDMRKLFCAFQRLDFFSPKTLSNILNTGIHFLIFAILDLTEEPIHSVLSTLDLGEGNIVLNIEIEGGEIFFLIFGALFVTLAWVLREAALIQKENDQFV
ncbi:MAG: DUF2975 domain-containing protein [Cohaesibacter sp.]|nr:DUF2975 domain-containing protein [Cohaesibacter sp.]MCV6601378.1 DUF2975 domain-containing protein [Cohaesibacter sp.]